MTSIAIRRMQSLSGPMISALALAACMWFVWRVGERLQGDDADYGPADRAQGAGAQAEAARAATAPAAAKRDGQALVVRNMFCATCAPPGEGGDPPPPPGTTRLAARLIATSVESPTRGTATLVDPASGMGGSFATGAFVPGGGQLVVVRRGSIDVRHPDDTIETVALFDGTAGVDEKPPEPPAKVAADDAWAGRVRALGDDRFEVDRALIGELMGGGGAHAVPGVRLMPVTREGSLVGIRVASARPGSLARALGLEPGDVIEAVDGQPITSAEQLLALYGRLDQLKSVELGVKRRGATRAMAYALR